MLASIEMVSSPLGWEPVGLAGPRYRFTVGVARDFWPSPAPDSLRRRVGAVVCRRGDGVRRGDFRMTARADVVQVEEALRRAVVELSAVAQTGLHYSTDPFDAARYEQVARVAEELRA